MYKAQTSPSGMLTNPVKVTCTRCHASLYIQPSKAQASGGWECPACGKRH